MQDPVNRHCVRVVCGADYRRVTIPAPPPTIRTLRAGDAAEVRALVLPELERSRYPGAPRAALDAVLDGTDPDSRALVAVREQRLIGVVIHGTIAGSLGAGRLQLIVIAPASRRAGVAIALIDAAAGDLRHAGARFVTVEMPDDIELAPAMALLARTGFHIEASVRDFFRDGVDLAVFRRELGGA